MLNITSELGHVAKGDASCDAGRAIAELIVHGRFESIDLTRLGYSRVLDNIPYAEEGIL
jgi:hypothetical protein